MHDVQSDTGELPANARLFPWYDSPWLESFVCAESFVRAHYPERLDAFLRAFAAMRTRADFGVVKLHAVFDEAVRVRLRRLIAELSPETHEKHEALRFGRSVVHDHPYLTELQQTLTERLAETVGEEVEPSYNFLSLYNNLGQCQVHLDAPSAKWTLDYCIDQSAVWPIHVSQVRPWPDAPHVGDDWAARIVADPDNRFQAHTMVPGEALVFGGSSQWHYRERIPRVTHDNYCHLAFFHFIPRGAGELVHPQRWAELFDIPELTQVVGDDPGPFDTTRLG